jgi:flavin reductase (DIM6/NTAB) family NADH-FMN oxidoreductase RutF
MAGMSLELDEELGYRRAMRQLAGGVSVVTVGRAPHRTGFTATSVSSLSVDPPRLIVSLNRNSSSYPAIERCRSFGVNVLAHHHQDIAARFGGGAKGEARYGTDCWHTMVTGASLLCDALAAFDCEIEEIIERHTHAIIIGRVVAARHRNVGDTLVYWRGDYHGLEDRSLDAGHVHWGPILASRNVGSG